MRGFTFTMRYIYLFILFYVSFSVNANADEATSLRLQRATLTVSDLDASLAFYTGPMGFTLRSRSNYDTPSLRALFPMPDSATPTLALLDAGPDQPRALALLHAPGHAIDAQSNRNHAPALLYTTLEMDRVHARMEAAGVEVLLPPTPLNDFSGKPFGREAGYLDPDGVRIVLFEVMTDD